MTKFCTNCGTLLEEEKKFCTNCGIAVQPQVSPVQPHATPVQPQVIPAQPVYQPQQAAGAYGIDTPPPKGSKYEPVSTLGFIGISLLACIPIVGLVLMVIWALGGCKKINQRNMARASLIMMAVGLIFSLVVGSIIKRKITNMINEVEQQISSQFDTSGSGSGDSALEGLEALEDAEGLGDLGQLIGMLGGTTDRDENGTGSDNTGETIADISNYMENVEKINEEASKQNDGWPLSLRKYPGGTATAVDTYRTEITGTTEEEVQAWIADLKSDGYEYQDFYDFGMSEEDMLSMSAWWGTNGEIYVSVSYDSGTVTVDHVNELPNIEDYFK